MKRSVGVARATKGVTTATSSVNVVLVEEEEGEGEAAAMTTSVAACGRVHQLSTQPSTPERGEKRAPPACLGATARASGPKLCIRARRPPARSRRKCSACIEGTARLCGRSREKRDCVRKIQKRTWNVHVQKMQHDPKSPPPATCYLYFTGFGRMAPLCTRSGSYFFRLGSNDPAGGVHPAKVMFHSRRSRRE